MSKDYGLNVKTTKLQLIGKWLLGKALKSYADDGGELGEPENTTPAPEQRRQSSPPMNFEDLIAKARKEEKDKLYPEIKRLRGENDKFVKQHNDDLLKIAELERDIESLRNNGESEELKKLKGQVASLEKELADTKAQNPDEAAIRASVKAELDKEYEVKLYRTEKLATDEVKSSVLPMFFDGITGTTKEEIDSAIENAINQTKLAKEQLGISGDSSNTATQTQTNTRVPTTTHPANPLTNGTFGGSVIDDISKLDMSNPEHRKKFAEWKAQQGLI